MTHLPALAAWVLAVLLVAASFYSGEGGAQAKPASTDASITTQVQNVIARDHVLRAMQIRVETQSGVVNLNGFVRGGHFNVYSEAWRVKD